MKVLAITIGDAETGSSKFRLFQYRDMLRSRGIELEFIHRDDLDSEAASRAESADLVFNQKCLFRSGLEQRIVDHAKRVVFDFDDAIWTRPDRPHSLLTRLKVRRRFGVWLRHAAPLIAANQYLASYAASQGASPVVLPMALDLSEWRPRPKPDDGKIRIGWAGSPGNLQYLLKIEPVLKKILDKHPQAQLNVYSGERPRLNVPYEYTPFEPGTEPEFSAALDIGLLPLENDEYLKGKSPIKAIQYMACGVPIIGNAYGATREILTPETGVAVDHDAGWCDALERLINNPGERAAFGEAGVQFVREKHDMLKTGQKLAELIKGSKGNDEVA